MEDKRRDSTLSDEVVKIPKRYIKALLIVLALQTLLLLGSLALNLWINFKLNLFLRSPGNGID